MIATGDLDAVAIQAAIAGAKSCSWAIITSLTPSAPAARWPSRPTSAVHLSAPWRSEHG